MNGAATRRGGSGGGGVGGAGVGGREGFASAMQPGVGAPTGKALVDGYKMDGLGGFEKDTPRYNPSNPGRPQSSALVDLKDPIQVHLLTETALSDSKAYEILSQEEVDELKKQIQSLSMRVEQARANLAIQSKYRDAAISMARLYSPSRAEGKRRSLLSNRMSDSAKEAEMEKQASERRCEELAAELFALEKSLVEPQRRLLQHTAGILQMTHRAPSKKPGQLPVGPIMNGMPGSPESLYTYSNNRDSLEIPSNELDFDDRSLYLPLDQMEGQAARPLANTIDIPLKSPIREQNAQLRELREELERIKEENGRILEDNGKLKTAEQQLKDELARVQEEQSQFKATETQLREEQARARDEIERLQSREQELAEERARAVEENAKIKDETTKIQDETSRFKEADARLRAIEEQMSAETEALRAQSAAQQSIISDAEAKLAVLNHKLQDVIVEAFNPTRTGEYWDSTSAADSDKSLTGQLESMEMGLATAMEAQRTHARNVSLAAEQAANDKSAATEEVTAMSLSLQQASARVQGLASQLQLMLQQSDSSHPPPPEGSLDEQIEYIEDALQTFASEFSQALNASTSATAKSKNVEQVDAVLMGLWEIIQTGYAEMEQQRAARRQNRAMGQSPVDDDDDLSSSELDGYTNEPYSLQAFSTKVQWLYAQATGLREQKYILQRQIKQQRDLNNRSESEKDRELHTKADELRQTQMLLDEAQEAAHEAQTQLERALADMDTLQKTTAANEAASISSTKSTQDQLKSHAAKLAALEAEVRDANARLAAAESDKATAQSQLDAASADLADLQTQLSSALEASSAAEAATTKLQAEIKAKDEELDQLNTMVIELKTEVAFAKAELDGAYGSRKQRAAEAAAISNRSSGPSAQQQQQAEEQVARLKAELENALRDLEEITRASIQGERERLEMEARLDGAEGIRADLEIEVAKLRERVESLQEGLDRERLRPPPSPRAGSGGRPGAGANLLSEQFRATMKEERKKFQEELREEQNRRRKAEEELRALKRTQGQKTGASSAPERGTLSPR